MTTKTIVADQSGAWLAWALRIFGTLDAYMDSLPNRYWTKNDAGWTSMDRDHAWLDGGDP